MTGMTVTSYGGLSAAKGNNDYDNLSVASAEPSQKAAGEAKVKQFLDLHDDKKSKSSGSHQLSKVHKSGGEGAPIVKINYNNACDLDRLDKFKLLIQEFTKIKKFGNVINFIIKTLPSIIPCQEACLFIFHTKILENKKGKVKLDPELLLQKTLLEGRNIDVIGLRAEPT